MQSNGGDEDDLGIPEFLKREQPAPKEPAQVSKDTTPMPKYEENVEADVVEAVEAPAPVRKKVKAKTNGVAKPAVKAKAAKAKPAAKAKAAPVKAKATPAKGKAKAPRERKGPADAFGFAVGSLKSKAAAMYSSNKGATLGEIKAKLDSSQLNLLTDLASRGYKVTKVKETGAGKRQVTRYFLKAK